MASLSDGFSKFKELIKRGKDFLSASGARYADAVFGGILWLSLVKFLAQSEYGQVIYWQSIILIFVSTSSLGLEPTFQSMIPKGKEKIKKEGALLSLFPTLGFVFILFFYTPLSLYSLLPYLFFQNRYKLSVAELLGGRKYREFFYIVLVKRAIQIIAANIFFRFLGINGVFLGLTLGVAVTSYRSLQTLLSISGDFDFSLTKSHLTFISYNFGRIALLGIVDQIDRVIIKIFYGASVLGAYGFITQIFSVLRTIPMGFRGYLLPEKSAKEDTKLAEIAGLSASAGSGLLALIIAPFGIPWLFPKYVETIAAICLLSVAPVIIMFSVILTTNFLSREEGQIPFLATIFSRIVKVVGVISLYSFFSYLGLGAGLVLTALSALIFLYLSKKIGRNNI